MADIGSGEGCGVVSRRIFVKGVGGTSDMLQTPTLRFVLASGLLLAVVLPATVADSRGDWVQPAGLSYGGIPYGSVSGMVADYYRGTDRGASLPLFGARTFGGGWNYLQPTRNNFID